MKFIDSFVDVTKKARKLPTSEYRITGKHPIIDQGQKQIAGYTDIEEGLFTDVPAIIFGDHTRVIKYIDTPFFIGADGVKVIKCLDKQANYNYLYYLLSSVRIPNTGYNRHYKWLKEAHLVEHTKEEQEKIVVVLSTIDNILDLYSVQLNKLDELIKSRFVEMFGDPSTNTLSWIVEPLSYHLSVIGGYAFKSDLFVEDGIPVLRIGNINTGVFRSTNLVFWKDDAQLDRFKMYPGDLVISLTGTVGKNDYGNVCILGNDYDVYYLNQRNAKLELKPTLNKTFLSELLKFKEIKTRLTGISRGVRQANISNNDILNLCVPISPIELQNQFADYVSQVDKTKSGVKQSIEKLETLKKSLMQEYFG